MYKMNDLIIYGSCGVCKIIEVGVPDITGIDKNKQYYTLMPINTRGKFIYTPIDNQKVLMRKTITEEQAKELIDLIPFIPALKSGNQKLMEEKYKKAINSLDFTELIKMIKALEEKQQEKLIEGKKLSMSDERYMKQAEDLLYSELAIVLKRPKDDMKAYIERRS